STILASHSAYPLSLHVALPIYTLYPLREDVRARGSHHPRVPFQLVAIGEDRPARRDVEQLRRQYPHEVARLRHGARDDPLRAERSEEHTSELQSHLNLVCRLLL